MSQPTLYDIKIYPIFKYSKQLSIIALSNVTNGLKCKFSDVFIDDDVFKEIKNSPK